MKPTLVIINYNGKSILPVALAAACPLADRFTKILVIDNGSTDGSAELAETQFGPLEVVRLGANLGAGGARNAGLRMSPTDLILFIDNDVALTAECIDRLMEAMAGNPKASMAAASIVYAHQRDTVQYDGAECHFLGMQQLLDEDVPVASLNPTVRSVGSIVTCAFLADRARLPPDEFFDESFFYMFEDHDFGVRVRMLGSEILSVPLAQCFHGKGTEGLSIRQLGTYSSKRVYYIIRNRWLFLLKNYSLRTLLLMAPLFIVYDFALLLVALKKGWWREWTDSVGWIVRNFPAILRDRRRIQRNRKTADRDVLVGGRIPFRAELTTSKVERIARHWLDVLANFYWKLVRPLI
ncbi:MAG: glycosyltransferase family 2 protein [Gammaproteobacteria bacterium]